MSIHNKMQSDYVWVRHAPIEEGIKVRNHGFHYLYKRAPNSVERLEMIYRSMGKQYDWELEKFRLSKKPIDKGNKKRMLRNLMRFIKHPYGYILGVINTFQNGSQSRFLPVIFGLSLLGGLYEWHHHSIEIQKHDQLLLAYGKNVEGMSGRYLGYHDTKPLRAQTAFDHLFRTPFNPHDIELNPTWKQNLRKQLHLTNYHNVQF